MSTRSTIMHGKDFHLFSEMMDEDNVYLELDNANFEAHPNSVIVTIPAAIWQSIRRYKFDLSLVGATDEEIKAQVEIDIDREIHEYNEHLPSCVSCGRGDTLCAFLYHMKEPREDRISENVSYRIVARDRQRRIRDEMKAHEPGGIFGFNVAEGTSERFSTVELEPAS